MANSSAMDASSTAEVVVVGSSEAPAAATGGNGDDVDVDDTTSECSLLVAVAEAWGTVLFLFKPHDSGTGWLLSVVLLLTPPINWPLPLVAAALVVGVSGGLAWVSGIVGGA